MNNKTIIPFNRYSTYIKEQFGERIQKITIDGGFSCPNRDGTKGSGGCTFCNNESFSPALKLRDQTITDQIENAIYFLKKRYKVNKFIGYFQPYSNTYAPLKHLKKIYEEALQHPDIIGLTIGTRPDCINEEVLDYLKHLSKICDITIEIGVESFNEQTLKRINRGHTAKESIETIKQIKNRGLKVCAHLIIGLPNDCLEDWVIAANIFSELNVDFVKIHNLEIIRDTIMEKEFQNNKIQLLTRDEYIKSTIHFLKNLSPKIIIQRLFDQSPDSIRIAPNWRKTYNENINQIIKIMNENGDSQGDSL